MTNLPPVKDVQVWIEYATDDLLWAKHDLSGNFFDKACFACQQSVEKILKAYLLHKNKPPPRIHKLPVLLELCSRFNQEFLHWKDDVILLDNYYIGSRYPEFLNQQFSQETAAEAISLAQQIVDFTTQKIVV